jgi:hypothetical protein
MLIRANHIGPVLLIHQTPRSRPCNLLL